MYQLAHVSCIWHFRLGFATYMDGSNMFLVTDADGAVNATIAFVLLR